MHAVRPARRQAGGFTLIEIMVAVVILSILLAVGIPTMSKWLSASRALGATEFYAEGLRMARAEALRRNAPSRLSIVANSNGQYDWQIDICDPRTQCTDESGTWSTTTTPASTDTKTGLSDYLSTARSAKSLPPASIMTVVPGGGADQVYFTPLGWINTTIAPFLNTITIKPATAGAFPTAAVQVTLGGGVTKCDPTITVADSRKCPL